MKMVNVELTPGTYTEWRKRVAVKRLSFPVWCRRFAGCERWAEEGIEVPATMEGRVVGVVRDIKRTVEQGGAVVIRGTVDLDENAIARECARGPLRWRLRSFLINTLGFDAMRMEERRERGLWL